jgi:cytoskeletal protein CcmA (bactofilin family)
VFRRRQEETITPSAQPVPTERVTSVLGTGIIWKGDLSGSGGVRIEGAFEGDISLRGLLVVGETGRLTCDQLRANVVIVAGAVRGDITCEKLEIRATGRVWGNVVTAAFATEEGAFLRGQIRMEEQVDISTTTLLSTSTEVPPTPEILAQADGSLTEPEADNA